MDLKEMRKTARISQAAVAAKTGIDRVRLSFAENGYIRLKPEEEQAVRGVISEAARTQGADMAELLSRCGVPTVGRRSLHVELHPRLKRKRHDRAEIKIRMGREAIRGRGRVAVRVKGKP